MQTFRLNGYDAIFTDDLNTDTVEEILKGALQAAPDFFGD